MLNSFIQQVTKKSPAEFIVKKHIFNPQSIAHKTAYSNRCESQHLERLTPEPTIQFFINCLTICSSSIFTFKK